MLFALRIAPAAYHRRGNFTRALGLACAIAAVSIGSAAHAQIAAPGTEGYKIFAGSGDVIATYLGSTASYSNDLLLQNTNAFRFNNYATVPGTSINLGSFAPGTELLFRLHVNNTLHDFYTGPASRNPDNQPHARVQDNWAPGTTLVSFEDLFNADFSYNDLSFSLTNVSAVAPVPEPSTWAMLLVGFALAGGALRQRRKQTVRVAF